MAAGIQIQGMDELIKRINKKGLDIKKEISREMQDSVDTIVRNAQRRAPVDVGVGGLRSGISRVNAGELTFEAVSAAKYSAYIEWGTKSRVSVPPELTAYAIQFKGRGSIGALTAREAIYAWAKRVGIPQKFWWLVFRKIMTKGIKPHPFFFEPFFIESPKLIKRIENVLNDI